MTLPAVSTDVLDRLVERAGSLYSLPAVAMDVLELTRLPRTDARLLTTCVERDPALTGKLLRVVNSSVYGLTREVTDLNQAVALLGIKPLKLLVLGFSLPVGLFSGLEASALERYWKFALVKAVAARELSQAFWNLEGDEAFITGLLQDIGVLVLTQELGEPYLDFLQGVWQQHTDLRSMETVTLGFDHVSVSAHLLAHWKLPASLIDAIVADPQLEQLAQLTAEDSPLPQILHLATLVAAIIADGRESCINELLVAADRYRAVRVDQIDALLDQLQERVQLMAQVFSVSWEQQESYRTILQRAHAQLSQAAVEAIPDLLTGGSPPAEAAPLRSTGLTEALDRVAQGLHPPAPPSARGRARRTPSSTRHTTPAHDPGLCGHIIAAISACRVRQAEVSLVLWELDQQADLLVLHGPEQAAKILESVPDFVAAICDVTHECLLVGKARFAIVLRDCDRGQATAIARTLVQRWPKWALSQQLTAMAIASSAGVATLARPSRHSHPEALIEAAERCLFAAQSSGGHVVKSIDVLA